MIFIFSALNLTHVNTKVVITVWVFFCPLQKDTGRELPPLNPQASFFESKRKLEQLLTTAHPQSLQEPGLSVRTIFRLAFTEERYHYSIAILVLLFLILLSLYFL